jgi:formylglycine-generating enzyme required for sulfatase activity
MKPLLSPCLVLAILSLLSGVAFAQLAAAPSVASLQTMYEDKVKLDVLRPHEVAVADLNTKFAAALDRAQETAQKSGNLDEAVAIKKEKEAVLAGGYSPSATEDTETPASIKTLRTTYRNTVAKLELERDKRWQPLKEALARSLNGVIDTLTKSGKLDEALVAKKLREELLIAKTDLAGGSAGGSSASPLLGNTFVNTLGMKFIPVPKTKILMCIHETRRQDFSTFIAASDSTASNWKTASFEGVPLDDGPTHPVTMVTWNDAADFCEWLSKKEDKSYRLPTDVEWGLALGIPKKGQGESNRLDDEKYVFPWGNSPVPPKGFGNYADTSFASKFPNHYSLKGYVDGFPTTSPVMSFQPSPLGFYDLGGNVWEWCEDWLDEKQGRRVARGGSWYGYDAEDMRSSYRGGIPPSQGRPYYGFRCVLQN